jgi:hypothetical protein
MTCRTQFTSFLALLFAALAFLLTAQMAGGLVWRGQQVAAGSNHAADVNAPS